MPNMAMRFATGQVDENSPVKDRADHDAEFICLPLEQLDDAERMLGEVLMAARMSVQRCEATLAWIGSIRNHAAPERVSPASGHHTDADVRTTIRRGHNEQRACAPTESSRSNVLTERETEVLDLMARGNSNREIADTLFLSPRTVERHIANIYLKIHAHSRDEAIIYAQHQHLD